MRRIQSKQQFNNAIEKRIHKDMVIGRIKRLFQSNGVTPKSIRGFDPSLGPSEITYLFSDDIYRFGITRLERIENSVLAALDVEVAA